MSAALGAVSLARSRVHIEVDGQTRAAAAYKNFTLGQILAKTGITSAESDIVSHDVNKPVKPLSLVKITRVKKEKKKITEHVPFRMTWSRRYNSNLRKTELQKGVEKTITKNVIETFYDGKFYSRETLDEKIIAKEIYRLALLSADNKVEKIYDLTKAAVMKMVATAYYPGDPLAWGDGTITFLGQKMQRG
ncbi:MAG: ubiquitin-like domain-containing protein, partial [Endomicrobium sp.]|nr:ubiquitin-like domain-containing protein [Endomicrobium sp.]